MKYQWNVAITAQCEPSNTNWRVGRFQICLYWGWGWGLINFGSQTSSLITQANKAKFFRSKFCKFFLLTEIWGRLTHFSVTNLLSIYDYILDK